MNKLKKLYRDFFGLAEAVTPTSNIPKILPAGEIEKSIDELDESTSLFFDFLVSSNSQYSIDDMLLDKELIPSRSEIEDPISWAARTSLPPI